MPAGGLDRAKEQLDSVRTLALDLLPVKTRACTHARIRTRARARTRSHARTHARARIHDIWIPSQTIEANKALRAGSFAGVLEEYAEGLLFYCFLKAQP